MSKTSNCSLENCEMMPVWEKLHKDILATDGEIQVLEGPHYPHFEPKDKIVSESLKLIGRVENDQKEKHGKNR